MKTLCLIIASCTAVLAISAIVWFAANALPFHSIAAFFVAIFFGFVATVTSHDLEAEETQREWDEATRHPRL